MLDVIQASHPTWIIGENVAGIVNMELDNYMSDLERTGYEVQAFIIPACAVDAKHRRDRVWIVANCSNTGIKSVCEREVATNEDNERAWCQWQPELSVGRVVNGVPRRVDRLRALGNAIVPQAVFPIMQAIKEIDEI